MNFALVGLVCGGLLVVIVYGVFKQYKYSPRETWGKMTRVYLAVFVFSVIVFAGIRILDIPEKLFPGTMRANQSELKTWDQLRQGEEIDEKY